MSLRIVYLLKIVKVANNKCKVRLIRIPFNICLNRLLQFRKSCFIPRTRQFITSCEFLLRVESADMLIFPSYFFIYILDTYYEMNTVT